MLQILVGSYLLAVDIVGFNILDPIRSRAREYH